MLPIRIGRVKLAAMTAIGVAAAAAVVVGVEWHLTVPAALVSLVSLGLASLIIDSYRALRSEMRRLRADVRALHRDERDDSRQHLAEVARWGEAVRSGHNGAVGVVESMAVDLSLSPAARSRAWVILARHHAVNGDDRSAYEAIRFARVAAPAVAGASSEHAALEADFLMKLGRSADAREVLLGTAGHGSDPDLMLRLSATEPDDDGRLARINDVYQQSGFAPLAKLDPAQALTIDNLTTVTGSQRRSGPLVSVIMTAFNSADMIATALRSLQRQTWTNLQVIVVDDASSDGTAEVAQRFADADERFEVVRLSLNLGAYLARNAGLALATGDLVTTHDADDWSHAQKIETQVGHLLGEPGLVGSMSFTTRVDAKMMPTSFARPKKDLVSANFSSIMLRRQVFDAVGEWDAVRTSGDAEMLYRVTTVFGEASVARVAEGVPLMLARLVSSSLTNSSDTGILSLFRENGARRRYRDAFQAWHSSESFVEMLPWRPSDGGPRPFEVPPQLAVERERALEP